MKYKIGILDRDYGYVTSLVEYINREYSNRLSVAVFTNQAKLMDYLSSYMLDAIVTTEQLEDKIVELADIRAISLIRLGENRNAGSTDKNYIYKFQSAKQLVEQVLEYLKAERTKVAEQCSFNCIYSPVGRSGRTTFALELVRQSKNGLYIGMENYPGGKIYEKYGVSKELNQKLLYFWATKNKEILELIRQTKKDYNNYIIPILAKANELEMIDHECFCWLKETLFAEKFCECTAVDLGLLAAPEILLAFDRVIVTTLSDEHARFKLDYFKDSCRESIEKLGKRIVYTQVSVEHM